MNCPFCNKDMKKGFLKSSHHMHWGEEQALGFLPNDLKLTRFSLEGILKGNFVESYYYSECKKIIVSVEDK